MGISSIRRTTLVLFHLSLIVFFFVTEIWVRWSWSTILNGRGCMDQRLCSDPNINMGNQFTGPGLRPNGPFGFAALLSVFPLVCYCCWCGSRDRINQKMAVVCFIGGATISLYLLNRWSQLCNYDRREMNELCTWVSSVVEKMNKDIGYGNVWLTNGTLLAAVRNQSETNYMIKNDHDMDFCFNINAEDHILSHLRRERHFFEHQIQRGTIKKFYVYPPFIRPYTGHSGPLNFDMEECPIEPLREVTGCNGVKFNVSIYAEQYLEELFGSDWRVPQAVNHWGVCTLFWWC